MKKEVGPMMKLLTCPILTYPKKRLSKRKKVKEIVFTKSLK
jgi:hypothetical protein